VATTFSRWTEQAELAAFGALGLSADQFGAMTPKEFNRRLIAEMERENREFERLAQLACWLMNSERPANAQVSVSQLLRRRVISQE